MTAERNWDGDDANQGHCHSHTHTRTHRAVPCSNTDLKVLSQLVPSSIPIEGTPGHNSICFSLFPVRQQGKLTLADCTKLRSAARFSTCPLDLY